MTNTILLSILVLGSVAFVASTILYFISQKFKTAENPLVAEIEKILPQANCGGCGRAGCHDFATACATCSTDEFTQIRCPVGGNAVMQKIADLRGFKIENATDTVSVLRCNGSCQNAPAKIEYEGICSCLLANRITVGKSGCPDGCLHLGDCVKACPFGALSMDDTTGLPVVNVDKCTSCGICVKTCPRGLFEIRPKGENGQMVYVACRNRQKGALARKNCSAACIGCMKCTKICPEIKVENNLSYIPITVSAKQYGLSLVETCPTGAIVCKQLKSGENGE